MKEQEIRQMVQKQKDFFQSGATYKTEVRMEALRRLKKQISLHENEIHQAIQRDLGKSAFESYMCETGLVLSEISYMLKHLRRFSREHRVHTPLSQFPSRSFQKPSPRGVVLIMSPWNYPFLLTMEPLVDAIAAGNTAILKPSAYSPATSRLIVQMIQACFPPSYVSVVEGGREENTCLLKEDFDYIFFTGSQQVGKEALRHAAEHLTPVTLELGGKSPCIVEASADIKLAARRIVFGKFLNCGQTCVAPDYLLCDSRIKEELIQVLKSEIQKQFGTHPLKNPDYGKLISQKHFDRVASLLDSEKIIFGGATKPKTLQIEPTLMDEITLEDPVMQQEIFGPILPILTYSSLEQAINIVNSRPHPLALYLFTKKKSLAKKVTQACGFGGGCINDTIIHLATSEMGFGGFGESGMGSYHGKAGFDTFSHYKSIVNKKTWLDLPMRYQPYTRFHETLVRFFLK